ncbi:hypothetical protein Peur_041586 [Populus x canadensis]
MLYYGYKLSVECWVFITSQALHRIFITSQVEMLKHVEDEIIETIPYTGEYLVQGSDRVWIGVSLTRGVKCERCWNYTLQVGSFAEHPTLCGRCYKVVAG